MHEDIPGSIPEQTFERIIKGSFEKFQKKFRGIPEIHRPEEKTPEGIPQKNVEEPHYRLGFQNL